MDLFLWFIHVQRSIGSVVMMDNASTHLAEVIELAINARGAILIYLPAFSPHLNPIENFFSMYKKYIKRNEMRMHYDWESVHKEALNVVDTDT